jgi:hypothetical protein
VNLQWQDHELIALLFGSEITLLPDAEHVWDRWQTGQTPSTGTANFDCSKAKTRTSFLSDYWSFAVKRTKKVDTSYARMFTNTDLSTKERKKSIHEAGIIRC